MCLLCLLLLLSIQVLNLGDFVAISSFGDLLTALQKAPKRLLFAQHRIKRIAKGLGDQGQSA